MAFQSSPSPNFSPSRVVKISNFSGSLSERPLYVYLPRGYDEQTERYYPVIYMHDGQNCFKAFVNDSYAGSWRADEVADQCIARGRMRECIIVGVSNGGKNRMAEYLPPYTCYQPPPRSARTGLKKGVLNQPKVIIGKAHQTLAYYRYEIDPYISQRYRILEGREHRATCGSSMGGLFSTYIAWEHPGFARHHAILSPSYWITKTPQSRFETIERLRTGARRDVRLWLDSGTKDETGHGDDGRRETMMARDALLENGYVIGPDFQYYLDKGAIHHETAWAARLHRVFEFLFPVPKAERRE